MSITRFDIKGADNAALQIASTAFPATILFSAITPVDGSFPAFTSAPLVYVKGASHTGRVVYVDDTLTTTTQFVLKLGTGGGAPGTYTVNLSLETEETPASAPIGTTVLTAPYYCSFQDVARKLESIPNSRSVGYATPTLVRGHILAAYGKINAALSAGGYDVPVSLSQRTLITGALTASDNLVTLSLDSSGDYEAADFPVGSTIRINGFSSNTLTNEFVSVVSLVSTYSLKVEFLKESYDANATIELCDVGFLFLKECNAQGATARVLRALAVKGAVNNEIAEAEADEFAACLEMIKSGEIDLDGLSIASGQFIQSLQTDEPDQDVSSFSMVDNQPLW